MASLARAIEADLDAFMVAGIEFQATFCEVLFDKGVPKSNTFGTCCAFHMLLPICRVAMPVGISKVLRSPGINNPAMFSIF